MYNLALHRNFTFWNVNLKNSYLIQICRRERDCAQKQIIWERLNFAEDFTIFIFNFSVFFDVHVVQFLVQFSSVQLFRILRFSVINKLQDPGRDLSGSSLAFSNKFWQFSSNFVNNCAYWRWKLRVHLIKQQLTDSWR